MSKESKGIAIGIDLGTTNSCVRTDFPCVLRVFVKLTRVFSCARRAAAWV